MSEKWFKTSELWEEDHEDKISIGKWVDAWDMIIITCLCDNVELFNPCLVHCGATLSSIKVPAFTCTSSDSPYPHL